MLLQNVSPFVEVVLFLSGVSLGREINFCSNWGASSGVMSSGGRSGSYFWGFVHCLSGLSVLFTIGDFVYYNRKLYCSFNGGNGTKGVPKSG